MSRREGGSWRVEILNRDEAASDGAGNTAERLTSHPIEEDDMATSDHKGAHSALEHLIGAQRAKLMSAQAVQKCLYEVLLYADGDDAVVHAEAAHVVVTLMKDALDGLDLVHLRQAVRTAEHGGTGEQPGGSL
jgi:hypothetical protein